MGLGQGSVARAHRRVSSRKIHSAGRGLVFAASIAGLAWLGGCQRSLEVGAFQCVRPDADASDAGMQNDGIAVPWHAGFENGVCDYTAVSGFCYSFPPVSFRVVDWPVHSGRYAAEIRLVTGTDGGTQPQGRCVRQGTVPDEAYYGAWFYLPKTSTQAALWNLVHFRTGTGSTHPIWDVSLSNDNGPLSLMLYGFLNKAQTGFSPPVPIGRWFHVVVYLKRAKDTTGAIALYLDEKKVVEFKNTITDDGDRMQWYVGSLAENMTPPDCTVYLDDITLRSSL